jgi:hypothetical protein
MPTTLICTGPTFTNVVAPGLPAITNLKTLAFFGTADDGINANRAPGGPAIAAVGSPVYDTNQANLGVQAGPAYLALDTQNTRDATMLAGGCTWMAVARMSHVTPGSASRAMIFGDYKVGGAGVAAAWELLLMGQSQVQIFAGNVNRAAIVQTISPITNYHCYAMTYSGGAAGTFVAYDFTENPTTGVPVSYIASGQVSGTQSMHVGQVASTENNATLPIEHAFVMDAHSVLSVPTMVGVYNWAKANLARRGVAC